MQRLNVNINDETSIALKELAQAKGLSVTEVVRRAVSVYKFIDDEVGDRPERTLQLHDSREKTITKIAIVS